MKTPVRVVLLIHTAQLYGAARSMLNHVTALRDRGYEFTALLSAHGPLEQALRDEGVQVEVCPFEHFGLKRNPWCWDVPRKAWKAAASRWRFMRFVFRHLRAMDRPLVHVHSTLVFHAALAAWLAGRPLVWHVREERVRQPHPGASAIHRWRRQFLVERRRLIVRLLADHIVYVSKSIRQKYSLPHIPSEVAFNCANVPSDMSRESPSPGALKILYAGRLTFEKGADEFLQICGSLLDRGIAFEAVMAGDASRDYLAFHQRRIRELKLEKRVRLVGYQQDMQTLYASSDVLLFPSHTEAFPRAVMEAMACGLPVVASSVGGIPEMIEHGRSGFLFSLAQPSEAVDALARLVDEPSLRLEIGHAAWERAVAQFSMEAYADRLDQLYKEMIAESR